VTITTEIGDVAVAPTRPDLRSDASGRVRDDPRVSRVLITRPLPGAPEELLREAGHEVTVREGEMPPDGDELRALAQEIEPEGLLCLLTERVDAELLDACPSIRAVSNMAVGTDNIDLAECERRGIPVGNTPGVLTEATADLAFALILACARKLLAAEQSVRAGKWKTWEPGGWLGADLDGATLLIVGPGQIGSAVARRAEGFGMQVRSAGRDDELIPLLAAADFVSLHCPLTDATRGLIGAPELDAMKPTAYLVNTARGEIVQQDALRAALDSGAIAGAGLDVTTPEPLPADDPLLGAPNLTVVPHIGSASVRTRTAMARLAAENLVAALAGEPMPNPVV
jgi:glyoxylate reductase